MSSLHFPPQRSLLFPNSDFVPLSVLLLFLRRFRYSLNSDCVTLGTAPRFFVVPGTACTASLLPGFNNADTRIPIV
jgi:hypothetical protein